MTTIEILKRGPHRTTILVDGKRGQLTHGVHKGFWRICELRGWTPQQAFDYLMASKCEWPWEQIAGRLGSLMICKAIVEDEALGQFKVTRNGAGELQCYRQKVGHCSTSIIALPQRMRERFAHVIAGAVYNEGGELLYKLT